MQKLQDSLKSNATYLRVCIQYEVLEGLPCWDSYKRFSEKFGDDVMDYPEFEFWFMRFYSGESDMKYEWNRAQSKQLYDLPTQLFEMVLDELDEENKIVTRQVSRGIRDLILKPTTTTVIEVNGSDLKVNGEEFSLNGPLRQGWISEQRRAEIAVKEFKNILRSKIKSEFIELDLDLSGSWDANQLFLGGIQNLPYPVKNLKIQYAHRQLTIDFLKSLSGPLEKIELVSNEQSYFLGDSFLEMEQIKSAKSLILTSFGLFFPSDLCWFFGFEEFQCRLSFVPTDALVELRENCRTSPSFKKCVIHYDQRYITYEIETALGMNINGEECEIREEIPGSDGFLKWFFDENSGTICIEKIGI